MKPLISDKGWTIYRREAIVLSVAYAFIAIWSLFVGVLLGYMVWG